MVGKGGSIFQALWPLYASWPDSFVSQFTSISPEIVPPKDWWDTEQEPMKQYTPRNPASLVPSCWREHCPPMERSLPPSTGAVGSPLVQCFLTISEVIKQFSIGEDKVGHLLEKLMVLSSPSRAWLMANCTPDPGRAGKTAARKQIWIPQTLLHADAF